MKRQRNFYIIIGIILIVVNLKIDFEQITEVYYSTHSYTWYTNGWYVLFYNSLLIFGIILLLMAYKLQRKINNKAKN
jgi:hypothetical protein